MFLNALMSYSKLVKLPLSDIIHKNSQHSLKVDSSADDRNINSHAWTVFSLRTRFVYGTFTDKLSLARQISGTALQENGGGSDPLGGYIGSGAVLWLCSFSGSMGKQQFETLLRFY